VSLWFHRFPDVIRETDTDLTDAEGRALGGYPRPWSPLEPSGGESLYVQESSASNRVSRRIEERWVEE